MVISERLRWDAADKGMRTVPRLRRTAVTAGCAGLFVLVLWANADAAWAAGAAAAYVLAEIAYQVWDRRLLAEATIVVGDRWPRQTPPAAGWRTDDRTRPRPGPGAHHPRQRHRTRLREPGEILHG
ncbi:hypothetical protein ACGFZA_40055 [Streptomyces sp. NPDC048211]|uniref:hypothetical protein n=1 Tax=Streptomyces sp. NPDC048211 TaxID=3365516 RepID=UPI0037129A5E